MEIELERLELQNPQWLGNPIYTPDQKRDIFYELSKDLSDDLIILINGPRRVGKSVLLKQLIKNLIEKDSISPRNTFFYEFSHGDTKETLEEVFKTYSEEIWDRQERAYLFFDEAQYIEGYESTIKLIYDLHKGRVKIFLTGSLSISYKRRMQESLAGRFFEKKLFPLSYEEYLKFTNPEEYSNYLHLKGLTKPLLVQGFAQRNRADFEVFLRYKRLPETVFFQDLEKCQMYISTVKDQSLNQDALTYFGVGKPTILSAFFAHISEKPGMEVNLSALSQDIFSVTEPTLSSYLDILEIMGMVYIVRNTLNPLKAVNSLRKAYVSSHFSSPNINIGYLVESYVLERLLSQGEKVTYYRKRDKEIDFLVPENKKAYEVKYRSQIKDSDFKFLNEFCTKNSYNPFVVSLKDVSASLVEGDLGRKGRAKLVEEGNILPSFIPAVFF